MNLVTRRALSVGATVAVLLCSAAVVQAGPWTNPSGDAGDFTYSNGGDLNGLFGQPAIGTNAIAFPVTMFVVNASSADSTDEAWDIVSFDIVVDPGLYLGVVNVFALGTYNVSGQGAFVDLTNALTITENDGDQRAYPQDMVTSVAFPIDYFASGSWNGNAVLDLSNEFPPPSAALHVELSASLFADGGITGGAYLDQSFESIAFEFVFIPEPGTLALLALGALAAVRRRRAYR